MKQNDRRQRGGSADKEKAQRRQTSGGCPDAHLAAHLSATQWLRGGWPPWGQWLLETLWRAAGSMFVGVAPFSLQLSHLYKLFICQLTLTVISAGPLKNE